MTRTILLIGIGGFLGSVARFLTAIYFNKSTLAAFPLGTFIANIAGCFLIGLTYGLAERCEWLTPEWRLFIATGFCGGYTTFSAFAYENIKLLQSSDYLAFATYSVSSFVVALLSTFVGLILTKI